ncbi:MAG: hypothetical protein Q7U08_03115, partial [Flavobacteriaceae bacterium]|nr:hypothetical protein [Flavobacteriaceae bacterium]
MKLISTNILKISLVIFISFMFSCDEIVDDDGATSCIREKIEQFKREKVSNPPRSVYSYQYKGKTVYYITADCCDQYNILYDVNCNVICSPDGGITGNGDGRCTDFSTVAT